MAKEKAETPILVGGVKFEFTGKELKEHFDRRVKELTEWIFKRSEGGIALEKTIKDKTMKLKQYQIYASHINPNYSYHLDSQDLFTYEITETQEGFEENVEEMRKSPAIIKGVN